MNAPNVYSKICKRETAINRGAKICVIIATLTVLSQTTPPNVNTNVMEALRIWSGITVMRPFAGVVITA
mgnify:CR=1 FL=1